MRIFGLGAGLFIVFFLWSLSLFCCFLSSKSTGTIGYAGVGSSLFAFAVTLVFSLIPKEAEIAVHVIENKLYDELFIGRVCLVVVMGLSAIAGTIFVVALHCAVPVYAKPLRESKVRT